MDWSDYVNARLRNKYQNEYNDLTAVIDLHAYPSVAQIINWKKNNNNNHSNYHKYNMIEKSPVILPLIFLNFHIIYWWQKWHYKWTPNNNSRKKNNTDRITHKRVSYRKHHRKAFKLYFFFRMMLVRAESSFKIRRYLQISERGEVKQATASAAAVNIIY